MMSTITPSVQIEGLTKDFGANRVLDRVNLEFHAGSIHALLGANGSGKSTLIKILAGYHPPTLGTIKLHGEPISLPAVPSEIAAGGVRFVHQDLGLIDSMSITDNLALALGYEFRAGAIDWRGQHALAVKDLTAVGLGEVDPRTLVGDLGPVQQTLVAMARALRGLEPGRGVLVLDEPTARLPNAQVDELLTRCRALRDSGIALIYVSHRLDEVFAMADRVSVLRDGKLVFDDSIDATDDDHLTKIITGPAAASTAEKEHARRVIDRTGTPTLSFRGVCGTNVQDATFDVYPGEILAVTGLVGSGRSELGRLVYGSQRITAGAVTYLGRPLGRTTPAASIERGIGYVPQERRQSAIRDFDLADNLSLASLGKHMSGGRLSAASQRAATVQAIKDLDVRPPDPNRRLGDLSGGNQQKVVLGKWLELDLKLLVLDEPTYGVDIGARRIIMRAVLERVESQGMAVLLLDSDIDLVARYADRVLVMRRGRITAQITHDDITVDRIAAASYAVTDVTGVTPVVPGPDQSHYHNDAE